jgi:hypothetical protein
LDLKEIQIISDIVSVREPAKGGKPVVDHVPPECDPRGRAGLDQGATVLPESAFSGAHSSYSAG